LPQWVESIKEEIAKEPELQKLVKLINQREAVRPWRAIIQEFHRGSREGFNKMWHRLKFVFYWQGACSQIKAYIWECDICQRNKSELTKPAGLLQPLLIPSTV
jgi:hypothetical protein